VFGISPPAIITPEQWAKQPEIIWQYLDLYFATETREESLDLGLSMKLDDVVSQITCPVLLYHAANDAISLPDRAERYREALSHALLTDHILADTHGCTLHLRDPIAPQVVTWADGI
jgi:pimeloyl-ACP methyl ester carboxylesterase